MKNNVLLRCYNFYRYHDKSKKELFLENAQIVP